MTVHDTAMSKMSLNAFFFTAERLGNNISVDFMIVNQWSCLSAVRSECKTNPRA